MAPRIDARWALQSGVASWVESHRYEVSEGPKSAAKFQTGLRKINDGALAAGHFAGAVGEALGRALASVCQGSFPAAMEDARLSGGLAALDLSFLGAEAVVRGALGVDPAGERGAFELALLSKAGMKIEHFEIWASGSVLADDAKSFVAHARAERSANELRAVLDETAPSPARASGRGMRAL